MATPGIEALQGSWHVDTQFKQMLFWLPIVVICIREQACSFLLCP